MAALPPSARTRAVRRAIRSLLAIGTSVAVSVTAVSPTARAAGNSGDQQRRVDQIIAELDRLGERIDAMGEAYSLAMNDQEDLAVEISETEARISAKEQELAGMQGELQQLALRSLIGGGRSTSLSTILSSTASLGDIVRKRYLTAAALNTGAGNTDALQGVIEDLTRERSALERKRRKAEQVAQYASSQLNAAEALAAEYQARQAAAEAELGALLRTERQRREQAALDAAKAEADKFKTQKIANVVAPSSKAGIAVNAALSQLGVRYVFGARQPGVAMDCSGLTSWAWGVAGVSIPRTSRTQYAGLTRVPVAAAEPGDLIFSGYPIHHVGIYIGNGQMVHAPRTGDVVRVAALTWSKVVGVGRPR